MIISPFWILRSAANFFSSATMLSTSLPGPAGGAYSLAWLATESALM